MTIPIEQCEDRRLYKIHSRNLTYGVYRADTRGFIGIREKFGDYFLFEEYHWDTGAPHGTVKPEEATEYVLPEEIALSEEVGVQCGNCEGFVQFVYETIEKDSHWEHLEETDCKNIRPYGIENKALFDWIEEHGSKNVP